MTLHKLTKFYFLTPWRTDFAFVLFNFVLIATSDLSSRNVTAVVVVPAVVAMHQGGGQANPAIDGRRAHQSCNTAAQSIMAGETHCPTADGLGSGSWPA